MRIPPQLRKKFIKEAIKNGMKVLTYDIETSHAILRSFRTYGKTYLHHKQVKVPSKVITIQYKWADQKKAKYLKWKKVTNKHDDTRNFDDSEMIEEFANNILSKADLTITQNGDKFDYRVLNERAKALQLIIMDQKPSIDILKLSRKSFAAASHKLDYRSEQQGLGGKILMVDDDWVDIEEKSVPVEKKMVPYGLKDIIDTEDLSLNKEIDYYKDLPVAVEKVILSFLSKKGVTPFCAKCRSQHRSSREIDQNSSGYFCKPCKSNKHLEYK